MKAQPKPFRGKKYLALAALLLVPAATVLADSYWQGGTSDFNVAASWNPAGVPAGVNADNDSGSNNIVLVEPGDPVWNVNDIRAGDGVAASGSFYQTGSTINISGWFRMADSTNSFGFYTNNGGTIVDNNEFHVGEIGNAVFEMDGGLIHNLGNPFAVGDGDFGQNPTGLLLMNGGTITTEHEIWLGEGHANTIGGTGTMIMKGGAVNIGSWFAIGRFGGIGDLEMSGGAITMTAQNGGNITVATIPSTGIVNQSGGFITNLLTQTWVCESSDGAAAGTGIGGIWNLNGGWDVFGTIHLTQNPGAVGIYNLNGGDLVATEITDNGGNGTFNFNGGTLHAGGTTLNFIHDVNGSVNLMPGGAKINTEGNDVIVSQALTDAGGSLTKLGAGTLTLTGGSSYAGNTVVSNGTLAVSTLSSADGAYFVKDNAGLSVILANAGGQFAPANVTLGATAGTTLGFDVGAFGNPLTAVLSVTGTLTVNGPTTVNIADADPVIGQFHLLQYGTKAGSGTFTLGTLPTGVVASLVPNGNYLDLNITSVAVDIWTGLASSNWDIGTTINWYNQGTLAPTVYTDGDVVQFDDNATGSTSVIIVTNVSPGTVTFANNALDYTLSGSGKISGAAHVTYSGLGMVTMETTNGYTGATILNAGTLVVSNLANGGVASPIGASTAVANNLVLGGGSLSYQGPPVTINRGYSLTGNYGITGGNTSTYDNTNSLDVVGNLNIAGLVTAGPGSSFVKSGLGTLTYSGVGTNQLSGGTDPGYQVVAGTLVFDGSAGHQVNHSQQEFWVGDTPTNTASIILTNTTLNIDSWFSLSRGSGNNGYVITGNFYNSTMTCGNFSEGWENGRPNLCTQILNVTNSTILDGGNFYVAESPGSGGTVNFSGNSVLVDGGPMLMGLSAGATGNVLVANSCIVTNKNWLSCGANGYGTLTLMNNAFYAEGSDFNFGDYGAAGSTGIFTFQDNAQVVMIGSGNGVYVGKSGGAIGVVYQSGNTLLNARSASYFQLGQAAGTSGTWYQNGGTNYAGGFVSIGRGGDTSSGGLLIVSGGLFDQVTTNDALIVGEQGTGQLIVTNTGVVISEAAGNTTNGFGLAIGWNGGNGEVDLGGGTLVANYVQGGTNGGSSVLNLNGGVLRAGPTSRLNFMTNLGSAYVVHTTTIDTVANTIGIAQPLLDYGNGGGLTKIGSGTLLLDGVNTYAGTTTVSAGTLGGTGTIAGPVVVSAGATLSPGDTSIGTLTLGSTLSLASTSKTLMKVSKTASASSSLAIGAITYGGTLVLQNISGTLTAGETFTLFTAGSYSGSFSSVLSQTPGQTVTWDTSQLTVNGTVKVATASATPVSLAPVVSGGNVNLSWPADQIGWQLQEQSNPLTVGISNNWVTVPGSGTVNQISIPVAPGAGSMFFRLVF